MSLFGRARAALRAFTTPAPGAISGGRLPTLRARYDAAQTTPDNRRHWRNADCLSAAAANSPSVRKTLRERARYEAANNSYLMGILLSLANDTVGWGPTLQLQAPDAAGNKQAQATFAEWALTVGLPAKLRTMRQAKACDGEAFAILTNNPNLPTPVKLDVRLVEADQVEWPTAGLLGRQNDAIERDAWGNPARYHLLDNHPGDAGFPGALSGKWLPAASVLHYFRAERPGQTRGVPEITPALELFAQLRRYTLAVVAAAETAADHALVIQTNTPPDGEAVKATAFDEVELERRMATVLPAGWNLGQEKPEQPATTYAMFVDYLLNEICRCLLVPFNIAKGNSNDSTYSSSRSDGQMYFRQIGVEQSALETQVLDPLLAAWLSEAALLEGFLPQSLRTTGAVPHEWHWPGFEHVDPLKEANAQDTRLRNGMTTGALEWARRGYDWREQEQQRASEQKAKLDNLMTVVGLSREEALAVVFPEMLAQKSREPVPVDDTSDEGTPKRDRYARQT